MSEMCGDSKVGIVAPHTCYTLTTLTTLTTLATMTTLATLTTQHPARVHCCLP